MRRHIDPIMVASFLFAAAAVLAAFAVAPSDAAGLSSHSKDAVAIEDARI